MAALLMAGHPSTAAQQPGAARPVYTDSATNQIGRSAPFRNPHTAIWLGRSGMPPASYLANESRRGMSELKHRRAGQFVVVFVFAVMTVTTLAAQNAKGVLWRDPGNIATRDLFWGKGADARAPKSPFTFLKLDTTGVQPKMQVRDAAGREWVAKFGEEVHAEVAANRIVWALGYVAEEHYFVPKGTVKGMKDAEKLAKFVAPDGTFTRASFQLRDPSEKRAERRWSFEDNPFKDTRELSGLKILMTMLCNWDTHGERNTRIVTIGGVDHYLVSDLGATFGKMGTLPNMRSKWNLEHFKTEQFIEGIDGKDINLDYEGWARIDKVPLEHGRWFAGVVSQLTDEQLRAAFRAAGASDAEIAGFSARMREKIMELQKVTGASSAQ